MPAEQVAVEVYAPGMSCDGTRVTVPDFAQALSLVAWNTSDHSLSEGPIQPARAPQVLVRFGPTGRFHDDYEIWEEISREVVA